MACAAAMILVSVIPAKAQSGSAATANAGSKPASLAAVPAKASKAKTKHFRIPAPNPYPPMPGEYNNRLWMPAIRHVIADQYSIWTSPRHLRLSDAGWLLPMGGIAAGLLVTDQQFSRHLSNSPSRLNRFDEFSNYGAYAMVGGTGAMYLWGLLRHNEHMREAGFLGGEALIDSLATTEVLKYTFQRARPYQSGAGDFWNGGTSFPSEHATASWALASMLAHEYPGPLTKILAYGLATAISVSRVGAKRHFPTDIFVGGTIGYLVAQHVFAAHHNPMLGGGSWNLYHALRGSGERRSPANMGSPYVPLNSWVYPAFERLAAMGYVQTAMLGMRPWTRLECVQLLNEAEDHLGNPAGERSQIAAGIVHALETEFRTDIDHVTKGTNLGAELDSVYTRVTGVSGQPLTDGYHFGQTIVNDYGRPYEKGMNAIAGFTGWATDGPLVGYIDGEFQHAPSAPPLPLAARQAMVEEDRLPASFILGATPVSATNRFQLLDSYVGLNFHNWQITFGKQSQWWGPDASGPMLSSTNAAPIDMFLVNRVVPFRLPSILGIFGPIRGQAFVGQLSGQHIVFKQGFGFTGSYAQDLNPQPFLAGEKISFKPTPNLEIGIGLRTIFGGPGVPFTIQNMLKAMLPLSNGAPGTSSDWGDARSEFDFSYRIPGMRNWLSLYADGFTDDEPSPLLGAWDKAAWTAGIYMPRLPGMPKLAFRVEGIYSDPPIGGTVSHGFFYFNGRYRSGYTNSGNLIGSWIGRQGQGAQAWLTYWQGPRDYVQFEYRHQKVSNQFVPNGGTITDGGVKTAWWVRKNVQVSALLQYERWDFPVLAPGQQTDFTTQVGVTFRPQWRLH